MKLCNWLVSLFVFIWTSVANIGSFSENTWTKSLSNDNLFLPAKSGNDTFDALPKLLALVDRSYFYGEWMDIQGNRMPKFSNERGFAIFHYDSLANFKIDLHLYDGQYVDGNAMTIMYNHTDVPSRFNQSNATIELDNFELVYQIGKVYGDLGEPISCAVNLTIYFVNLSNYEPYVIHQWGSYNVDQIGIQVHFETLNGCPLNLTTSVMSNHDPLFQEQVLYYIFCLSAMTVAQCIVLALFDRSLERKPYLARRTSAWSLVVLNAFDLYFFLSVAYFFMNYNPIYELSTIPCIFLAFCFEPRVVWRLLQANRNMVEAVQTNREIKTYFCMLFLFMCVLGSLVILPDFSYILSATYLVPQIIHNFKTSMKYRWNFWIIGGLSFPKIIYIFYSKLDANNLLRISPDFRVVIAYSCLVIIQLVILAAQTKWPRFGFELDPLYKIYTAKTPKSQQDLCAICLDKLKDSFADSNPSTSFIGTDITLKDRRKILTPCKHEFHLACLGKWLDSKLECPYCRQCLPLLPEEYLDD